MIPTLAIIAGRGELPDQLLRMANTVAANTCLVCIEGQTPPALPHRYPRVPSCWVQLGQVGKLLGFLKAQAATHLVMIGALRRPSWEEIKLDSRGMRVMAKMAFKPKGDDALLKIVMAELEHEGLTVVGIQDIFPNTLSPEGCPTKAKPQPQHLQDIAQGWKVLETLSPLDVGQAVVVQQGLLLALEAIEGTDAMICRAGALKRGGSLPVLVKRPKIGQDSRADLPTLGPQTIETAHKAGLAGIVFQAGSTLLVDPYAMIEMADAQGLFILGRPGGR